MMDWAQLKLSEPSTLLFGDSTRALIRSVNERRTLSARPQEFAIVQFDSNQQIELVDCIDTSPNYESPWVLIVMGNYDDRVLLFGGETLYVISSSGQIVEKMKTFRRWENKQFWRTEVVSLGDQAAAIIYEIGILSISSELKINWHVEKALIDFFDHVEPKHLVFLRDHERLFTVDAVTGTGVPSME
jgi:hypothetical protein